MGKSNNKSNSVKDKAGLKEFRKNVSTLKKKGLLDKKYDARSVTPTKYLLGEIKRMAPVLKGEAQSVKVSKDAAQRYKAQGYDVKGGRVIVPVLKNEKAYSRGGKLFVKVTGSNGHYTRVDLGFDKRNLNKWAEQLEKAQLNLKRDEVLAFQFGGHNSYRAFEDLEDQTAAEQMIEYLSRYDSFLEAMSAGEAAQEGLIEGIVIFRITRNKDGRVIRPPENEHIKARDAAREERRKEMSRRRYDRFLSNMSAEQERRYLDEKATAERDRRARMRRSDADGIEKYKEAAKARAKKSREAAKARKAGGKK